MHHNIDHCLEREKKKKRWPHVNYPGACAFSCVCVCKKVGKLSASTNEITLGWKCGDTFFACTKPNNLLGICNFKGNTQFLFRNGVKIHCSIFHATLFSLVNSRSAWGETGWTRWGQKWGEELRLHPNVFVEFCIMKNVCCRQNICHSCPLDGNELWQNGLAVRAFESTPIVVQDYPFLRVGPCNLCALNFRKKGNISNKMDGCQESAMTLSSKYFNMKSTTFFEQSLIIFWWTTPDIPFVKQIVKTFFFFASKKPQLDQFEKQIQHFKFEQGIIFISFFFSSQKQTIKTLLICWNITFYANENH